MESQINKCKALTKDEINILLSLIEGSKIINSKCVKADINKMKIKEWKRIGHIFNATVGTTPRTPKQLRLKWDNLKKFSRKRSAMIQLNQAKTGDESPKYIPPNKILDRVADILKNTKCHPPQNDGSFFVNEDDTDTDDDEDDVKPIANSTQIYEKAKPLILKEINTLLTLIETSTILFLKSTNATTSILKHEEWERIAEKFNRTTTVSRTPHQLRLKWENLKSRCRRRSAEMTMTGGAVHHNSVNGRVLKILQNKLNGDSHGSDTGLEVSVQDEDITGDNFSDGSIEESAAISNKLVDECDVLDDSSSQLDAQFYKNKALSMEETKILLSFIEKSEIINDKSTDATSNKMKMEEWKRIYDIFNATAGTSYRSIKQLRLKWENLKKASRKRSNLIRLNQTRAGGRSSVYIPQNKILDRVADLLEKTKNDRRKIFNVLLVDEAATNSEVGDIKPIDNYASMKVNKPLTEEETNTLLSLIETSKHIRYMKTDATSNILKAKEWAKLTDWFNNTATIPRTRRQLQLKWNNLKKCARRRHAELQMTGVTNQNPSDDVLDKVSKILRNEFSEDPLSGNGDLMEFVQDEDVGSDGSSICSDTTVEESANMPDSLSVPVSSVVDHELPEDTASQASVKIEPDTFKTHILQKVKMKPEMDEGRRATDIAMAEYYKAKKLCMDAKLNNILLQNEKLKLENEKLKLEVEQLRNK